MRQFQRILHELKSVVSNHRPGEILLHPESLPTLDIGGHKLAYAAAGLSHPEDIPPVILLHGFGGFFMDWPRVMMPLARHTRVYALDLPGWGFSEPNPRAVSIEDDVRAVQKFMEHLGIGVNGAPAILCGISYGAGVSWAAAAMGMPGISRAVLLNPMPTHPLDFMRSAMYRGIFFLNSSARSSEFGHRLLNKEQYKLICRENLLNDRLLDSFYLDLAYLVTKQPKLSALFHAHAQGARTLDWSEWDKRLNDIRIPVSILQGKQDRIFSPQSALHLHRLIPTSELIQVDDCGHAMVFDQHRKVSDFILKFVKPAHAAKVIQLGEQDHELPQEDLRHKSGS